MAIVYSHDVLLHLREHFWLGRAAPAPSTLQQLSYSISSLKVSLTPQFSPSIHKERFITVFLSWRKTVQLKKKKKDNSLSHQKTSVLCPSAPALVGLSTGCLRSRNARLCHQREISDRKRLQGCRAGMGREQPSSSKVLQTSTKH